MTSATLTELGSQVRQARREAELTQAELAAAAGISRFTVIRLEGGSLADINYKTLVGILGALGLRLTVGQIPISGLPVLGDERS